MRGLKALLLATALLLPFVATVPQVNAQVSIGINLGGPPPSCPYGYYGYAPYGCAPAGYYGSGYFYNGIFLGVGPWANYGYGHGWGEHRFVERGGGRYGPGERGYVAVNNRTVVNNRRTVVNNDRTVVNRQRTVVNNQQRGGVRSAPVQHAAVQHSAPQRAPASHAAPAARGGGGERH